MKLALSTPRELDIVLDEACGTRMPSKLQMLEGIKDSLLRIVSQTQKITMSELLLLVDYVIYNEENT